MVARAQYEIADVKVGFKPCFVEAGYVHGASWGHGSRLFWLRGLPNDLDVRDAVPGSMLWRRRPAPFAGVEQLS